MQQAIPAVSSLLKAKAGNPNNAVDPENVKNDRE
jgi:hypothetical protein